MLASNVDFTILVNVDTAPPHKLLQQHFILSTICKKTIFEIVMFCYSWETLLIVVDY